MKHLFVNTKDKEQRKVVLELAKENEKNLICTSLSEKSFARKLSEVNEKTLLLSNEIPIWNSAAAKVINEHIGRQMHFLCSYELTRGELFDLFDEIGGLPLSPVLPIYGRIPLMRSKNCVRLTSRKCTKQTGFSYITDRKGARVPVFCDCTRCENIIYNSIPTSLHKAAKEDFNRYDAYYLGFTDEPVKLTKEVMLFFINVLLGKEPREFPIRDYTTTHYKSKVE